VHGSSFLGMLATLVIGATGSAEAAVFAPHTIVRNATLPVCVKSSIN
jgi:hypothetical protein